MANIKNKLDGNVPGKFYVDDQCIGCDLCIECCPDCFSRNNEIGCSAVYKQPANENETDLCIEAMENCPVNAIGNDGK